MKDKFKKLQKNRTYRVIQKLLRAILSLFVVLVVSVIFIQRVSNNNISLFGYRIFNVVTESMLPKYQVGDMIIAKDILPSNINIGDDVVYIGAASDFKDKIVTHQVIDIENNNDGIYFHTKGINNTVEDPLVYQDQILGKVLYRFVVLSVLSKVINNMYGFYFLIFIPFVVLLFFEILDVMHGNDRYSKSKKK